MTGLEKILESIANDSDLKCKGILSAAEKQSKKILEEAKADAENQSEEIEKNAKEQAESIISMANSSANSKARQILLTAKVQAVNETLEKLLEALNSLDEKTYFSAVIKLASEHAIKGECTAFLSEMDLSRLPKDFEENLKSALSKVGASCTLSKEKADINSGVILDYGNICVNCSFEAIVEEKSDYYKEKISKIIL